MKSDSEGQVLKNGARVRQDAPPTLRTTNLALAAFQLNLSGVAAFALLDAPALRALAFETHWEPAARALSLAFGEEGERAPLFAAFPARQVRTWSRALIVVHFWQARVY